MREHKFVWLVLEAAFHVYLTLCGLWRDEAYRGIRTIGSALFMASVWHRETQRGFKVFICFIRTHP